MVRMCPDTKPGFVHAGTGRERTLVLSREEKSSLGERKQCSSLLAMVSDVEAVNAALPLVLLINERHISRARFQALEATFRNDDHCWPLRLDSAWNDSTTMVWLLETMRKSLLHLTGEYRFCLLVDCCSCHITDRVVAKAARSGFILVFVPSGMTSLLQPLDVYVFARFKSALSAAFEQLGHSSSDGHVQLGDFAEQVLRVAKHLLFNKDWTWAFRKCGFGNRQRDLAKTLLDKVPDIRPAPDQDPDLPSLAELKALWPGGKTVPIGWLFHWCNRADENVDEEVVAVAAAAAAKAMPNPWLGRLRSSSRLHLGSEPQQPLPASPSSRPPWRPKTAKPIPHPSRSPPRKPMGSRR